VARTKVAGHVVLLPLGEAPTEDLGVLCTEKGSANYLEIRSYVSTARKQGVNAFGAVRDLLEGQPLLPSVTNA